MHTGVQKASAHLHSDVAPVRAAPVEALEAKAVLRVRLGERRHPDRERGVHGAMGGVRAVPDGGRPVR